MNVRSHSTKRLFKILVIENDSSFYEVLLDILYTSRNVFPSVKFNVGRASTNDDFEEPDMQDYNLIFIEDQALMNVKKQKVTTDFVLLLNGYFFKEHAKQFKKIISKKSLNLYEHISLTNYSFDLIKLLVVDFIKSKLKCSKERKTPNSSSLSY